MTWIEHAICWHVYPLGFLRAPRNAADHTPAHGRRLRDLVPWLDHVIELGANVLLLGPIFASTTHGYDSTDHRRIDPRLGDEEDFDILVRACHERGIRLVLDGVFNHVGSQHPCYLRALQAGKGSEAAQLFRIDFDAPGGPVPHVFEGHGSLISLDHRSPQVARLVGDAMTYWLDRGADGWRLDAAYAVDPDFWRQVLPGVRERHPEAFVFGEVIHGDYLDLVRRTGWNSLTQYELWKAIWSSLKDENFYELAHALRRHAQFCEHFSPVTFVGNHDVTRIASQVGPQRAVLALAVLMTLPGTPSVYYGDELAMRAVKEERSGGDDAIRPEFAATPAELARDGQWMLNLHRGLIGLRRQHPWLHRGVLDLGEIANERLTYTVRDPEGAGALTVDLDITDITRNTVRIRAPRTGQAVFDYLGEGR